jgi:hypothetical protein
MHLTNDYIHPTPRGGKCRVRIYLPEEEQDSPVVICSELSNDEGSSVTYSVHQIAAEVIRYHKLPVPVWIEHYPPEATDGTSETFELVVFSSYEIREKAPYLGETRITIGGRRACKVIQTSASSWCLTTRDTLAYGWARIPSTF